MGADVSWVRVGGDGGWWTATLGTPNKRVTVQVGHRREHGPRWFLWCQKFGLEGVYLPAEVVTLEDAQRVGLGVVAKLAAQHFKVLVDAGLLTPAGEVTI